MSLAETLKALIRSGESLDRQRVTVLGDIRELENAPASLDPDEIAQNRDALAAKQQRLADLEEAIRNAEAAKADTARKAKDEAEAAEAVAEERQVATDAKKLPAAALSAIGQAISAIQALNESNDRTASYNAGRGTRPFIIDAESRARQTPGRTIPAEYRDEIVWEDGAGNRPSVFRRDDAGQPVPVEAGYTRKAIRVCVQSERLVPASMPDRLAELLPALKKALGK